jgi:pectinesterase
MKHFCVAVMLAFYASTISAGTMTVAVDGSGDFKTVQDAIKSAPDNGSDQTIIHIKPGTYEGPIIVARSKAKITLQGDDPKTTTITWSRNVQDPIPEGADKFNPGMQVLADDFRAENLTIENTSGNHGQALALRLDGDRAVVKNCRITGWQDTLMINNGRQYFKDCFISGRVDFIYGSATAVFDHCEIHSRNGGHITAASTPQNREFGFVFLNCNLTGDAAPWVKPASGPASQPVPDKLTPQADLGRPWRPYAAVAYINCQMGDHIKPQGWDNWRNPANEKTARYVEYNSTGPGANPDKRFPWTKQLTKEEAEKYTVKNILSGSDNWNPEN